MPGALAETIERVRQAAFAHGYAARQAEFEQCVQGQGYWKQRTQEHDRWNASWGGDPARPGHAAGAGANAGPGPATEGDTTDDSAPAKPGRDALHLEPARGSLSLSLSFSLPSSGEPSPRRRSQSPRTRRAQRDEEWREAFEEQERKEAEEWAHTEALEGDHDLEPPGFCCGIPRPCAEDYGCPKCCGRPRP